MTWSNINKIEGKYLEAENNLQESLNYAANREEKVIVYRNLSQVFQAKYQTIEQRKTNIVAENLDIEAVKKRSINDREKALSNARIALELSKDIESLVTVDALLQILRLGAEADTRREGSQRVIRRTMIGAAGAAVALLFTLDSSAQWPGWRGPDRNGRSGDTDLLREWPEGGQHGTTR